MSDTTPPVPPEPTPPNAGYTPPVQPESTTPNTGYTAQPTPSNPYAPTVGGPTAKAPVMSIISLTAGIVGLLGAWIVVLPIVGSILGLFIPTAAIILGVLAKKREPQAAKAMWLTGIILGIVALAIAVIALIFWIVAFAAAGASGSYDFS